MSKRDDAAKPVIGLVGGIGAGKSRVSAALARRGGRVVAGDPAGHAALRQPAVRERVVERWGAGVMGPDGEVDRRELGSVVFADPAEREALEAIVRPWIGRQLRAEIAAAQSDPAVAFVVLDAAVMLEAGWRDAVNLLVYVHAPRAVRLARVAEQRGWSAAEVAAREQAQLSLTEKAARADVAVDNSGSPADLEPQLDRLLARLGIGRTPAVDGRRYDEVRA
jgi:dephospho-CoA kinase